MRNQRLIWIGGFFIALVLAGVVSYYASGSPDGLEKVAEEYAFIGQAQDSVNAGTPLNDYSVAGVENERASVGIAGVIGVLVTAAVSFLIFGIARRRPANRVDSA